MLKREELEKDMAREKHRKELVDEAYTGTTKLDILPNTAQPLSGEVEAMYFNSVRAFFKNYYFKSIIENSEDLYEGI